MKLVELTGEWNSVDRERMRCQNYLRGAGCFNQGNKDNS